MKFDLVATLAATIVRLQFGRMTISRVSERKGFVLAKLDPGRR